MSKIEEFFEKAVAAGYISQIPMNYDTVAYKIYTIYLENKTDELTAEVAELRARLDRAVELPLLQTIRGNKLPYEVAYKDNNGRIIVTKYRRWQKKQAEARLKELQGGER